MAAARGSHSQSDAHRGALQLRSTTRVALLGLRVQLIVRWPAAGCWCARVLGCLRAVQCVVPEAEGRLQRVLFRQRRQRRKRRQRSAEKTAISSDTAKRVR